MIKVVFIVFGVLIAAVLIYATTLPDEFRVQRTARIKAPPEAIFALITDFHRWGAWSPYETKDPAMKRIFSGAASGQGAVYEWQGNSDVGTGRMEVKETTPPSRVIIQLDFLKPMEAHNIAEFTLEPGGDFTQVTWNMVGPMPFLGKLMQVFFNMDKMVGNDFAAGLAKLKTATEK